MPVTRVRLRAGPGSTGALDLWLFVPTTADARFDPDVGSLPWPRGEGRWANGTHLGTTDCDEDGVTTLWDDNQVTTLALKVGDQLRRGMPATLVGNGRPSGQPVEIIEVEVL